MSNPQGAEGTGERVWRQTQLNFPTAHREPATLPRKREVTDLASSNTESEREAGGGHSCKRVQASRLSEVIIVSESETEDEEPVLTPVGSRNAQAFKSTAASSRPTANWPLSKSPAATASSSSAAAASSSAATASSSSAAAASSSAATASSSSAAAASSSPAATSTLAIRSSSGTAAASASSSPPSSSAQGCTSHKNHPDARPELLLLAQKTVEFYHACCFSPAYAFNGKARTVMELATPADLADFWLSACDAHVLKARTLSELLALKLGTDYHVLEKMPSSAGGGYVGRYAFATGPNAVYCGESKELRQRNNVHVASLKKAGQRRHYAIASGHKQRLFVRTSRVEEWDIQRKLVSLIEKGEPSQKAARQGEIDKHCSSHLAECVRRTFELFETAFYQSYSTNLRHYSAYEAYVGLPPTEEIPLNDKCEVGQFCVNRLASGLTVGSGVVIPTSRWTLTEVISRGRSFSFGKVNGSFRIHLSLDGGEVIFLTFEARTVEALAASLPPKLRREYDGKVAVAFLTGIVWRLQLRVVAAGREAETKIFRAGAEVARWLRQHEVQARLTGGEWITIPFDQQHVSAAWVKLFDIFALESSNNHNTSEAAAGPSQMAKGYVPYKQELLNGTALYTATANRQRWALNINVEGDHLSFPLPERFQNLSNCADKRFYLHVTSDAVLRMRPISSSAHDQASWEEVSATPNIAKLCLEVCGKKPDITKDWQRRAGSHGAGYDAALIDTILAGTFVSNKKSVFVKRIDLKVPKVLALRTPCNFRIDLGAKPSQDTFWFKNLSDSKWRQAFTGKDWRVGKQRGVAARTVPTDAKGIAEWIRAERGLALPKVLASPRLCGKNKH